MQTCYFQAKSIYFFLVAILVKFPHSPILNYAFSSWIEKTMTKTINFHRENRFLFTIVWGCAEILSTCNLKISIPSKKDEQSESI